MGDAEQIRVEGPSAELEQLRRDLVDELGTEIDMQEVSSSAPGELREPILIGLVIALGGPKVVEGVTKVVSRYLTHREKMTELGLKHQEAMKELDLRFYRGDSEEAVPLDQLLPASPES